MALQMGAILFFCIWIGQKIDHHFGLDKPWFTMALVLLGFIGTIYSLNLQLREDKK
ncbi:MAG: AtpZ/AtpI family protein [Lewinellaceae bacterium]|nr:AtpZ/AtpI family protein [Saprospiraceae bacterium]MCB9267979.1 AtpZ/AtpI family protein [Lewinellaceae bacterium]